MRKTAASDGSSRSGKGQALTEFALVAPVVFLLLFGIIQVGFLFSGQNGLVQAAREAARYASTLPTPDTTVAGDCSLAGTNAKSVYDRLTNTASGNLHQYIAGYFPGNLVSGTGPLSNCGTWAATASGTGILYCAKSNGDTPTTYSVRVRVSVLYKHPLFIPLIGRIFSSTNTFQLGATEEMRVEGPNRSNAGGFTTCP